jgi:hypothetical protein
MAGMEFECVLHDVGILNVQIGGTNSDHYALTNSDHYALRPCLSIYFSSQNPKELKKFTMVPLLVHINSSIKLNTSIYLL